MAERPEQIWCAVLDALRTCARWNSLFVTDVECNENRNWVERPPFCVTTDELFRYAESVGQFDWASFFFGVPGTVPTDKLDYDTLFTEASVVVRAVDNSYFFVYSANSEDAETLSRLFSARCEKKRRAEVVHPT